MALNAVDQQINDFLSQLSSENYIPNYEFLWGSAGGESDDFSQLYALPYTDYQRERFGKGSWFASDPDRDMTSQGLYTGRTPEALQITEEQARTDPRFAKDFDIWERYLAIPAQRKDSWNPLGDNLFPALAALGLATGGAALAGGFAAPAAGAGAGAIGAADVGGSIAPIAASPTLSAATSAPVLGGAGAVGGTMAGSGLVAPISTLAPTLGSLGAGAAGTSGLLGTLGSLGAWAPLISSGISGLGSLIGGAIGSGAAKDAARTQADAAQQANILLAALYDQQRTDMAPYREAGYAALSQLGDLVKSPVTMGTYTAPKPLMATFAPQYPPSRR